MLVRVSLPPPSTPTTDGVRSALLLGSVAPSNDARRDCVGARWTFGAARRGIMTLADQADACVSSPTTLLDSHDRRGPVCASPGIGSLILKRRPTRLAAWAPNGPYSGCNHVAWLMPDAMARCTPPPAHVACRCIPRLHRWLSQRNDQYMRFIPTYFVVVAVVVTCPFQDSTHRPIPPDGCTRGGIQGEDVPGYESHDGAPRRHPRAFQTR